MRTDVARPVRYLFIGGLHRSGTSLVNRLANALPGAGGITGSPAPENEGVYLQGAIPHTARSGIPMQFATDPAQHLTEDHALNRLETRQRLDHDWDPWFEPRLQWRIEKSPVNLTRARLLQQLFPTSQFIFMLRHPEAGAASVAHWTDLTAVQMHDHWLAAYEQLLGDLPYLHAAMCVRYEDVVADPGRSLRQIAAFLSLPPGALPETVADGNARYSNVVQLRDSDRAAQWGYAPGLQTLPWDSPIQHPLRAVVRAVQDA